MSIYIIKEGEMMKDEKKRKKTCSFTLDAETISKIESLAEARRSSKSQVITDLIISIVFFILIPLKQYNYSRSLN